jgi:phage gpG-like protein
MFKEFVNNLTKDTEVKLTEEFDRNFERKAFFDRKWPATKHTYKKGSLLLRSGRGRRSIKSRSANGEIRWNSALPYMSLHNEGGEVVVTAKMKRYFWAMYYKVNGAKGTGKTQRNKKLEGEAAKWKAMAL